MGADGFLPAEVAYNGAPSSSNGFSQPVVAPFTVDQALPYSPFSSIIPLHSEIIPRPSISHRSSSTIYSKPADREAARQTLDSLNHEARHSAPGSTSQRLEQSLIELGDLLRTEELTQYNFKMRPTRTTSEARLPQVVLSPFAQIVFETTELDYTQASEDEGRMKKAKAKARHSTVSAKAVAMPQPQIRRPSGNYTPQQNGSSIVSGRGPAATVPMHTPINGQRASMSSKIAVVIPSSSPTTQGDPVNTLTSAPRSATSHDLGRDAAYQLQSSYPQHISPSQALTPSLPPKSPASVANKQTIAVIIPKSPADFHPDQYTVMPASPSLPEHLSKKRKRSTSFDESTEILRTTDKQQRSQAAITSLETILHQIFDAEDQYDPAEEMTSAYLFATADGVTLSSSAIRDVDSKLARVLELGALHQLSIDDLLRLQKLCEASSKQAEVENVKIDTSTEEGNVAEILDRLATAENSIKAARLSLKLMLGGREEKPIYSENIMHSAVEALRNILEGCIIPVVEMRSTGTSAAIFRVLAANRQDLARCLLTCRKLLSVLVNLATSVELSEMIVNTLEYMSAQLLFVENAHAEKDSIIGIGKFDNFRIVAMDLLAQIYTSRPSQRNGILNNVLTSLEKLPVTKQSARQFKIGRDGNIQLVSAFIMLLIQASANNVDEVKKDSHSKALRALDEHRNGSASEMAKGCNADQQVHGSEEDATDDPAKAIDTLESVRRPLRGSAEQAANYFVSHIITKAQNSTKSGDSPFRTLLDLFVQDFILCLRLPEWPAASILLQIVMIKMWQLVNDAKTAAPAKNMALDSLSLIVAGISELNSIVRASAHALEVDNNDSLGTWLKSTALESLQGECNPAAVIAFEGLFRNVVEHLGSKRASDPQIQGAIGYIAVEWTSQFVSHTNSLPPDEIRPKDGALAYRLRMMLSDKDWLFSHFDFKAVPERHAQLAYATLILHSRICSNFGAIMQLLLDSMGNEQATVRSKSLKSILQVIETDPSILDRERSIIEKIRDRTKDSSPQVRDSALSLIQKCICLRPKLRNDLLPAIVRCIGDQSTGVRKRAMKLAKDVSLDTTKENRGVIAEILLQRATDLEEGIRDLARQIMQDVWFVPFYDQTSLKHHDAQSEVAVMEHVSLMIGILNRSSGVSASLEKIIKALLLNEARVKNLAVCRLFVGQVFDNFISKQASATADDPSHATEAQGAFQLLTMFARSSPGLLTMEQIDILQPYLSNLDRGEVNLFISVVNIYRQVLPNISKAHQTFLENVRIALQQSISKVLGSVLDDVVACLWTISTTLQNPNGLRSMVLSVLEPLHKAKSVELRGNPAMVRKLCKQMLIAGVCGKNCNFDDQYLEFQKKIPTFKDKVVSKLLCTTFTPYAVPDQPSEIRRHAIEAIGMVCQSWPKNFAEVAVYTTFRDAFEKNNRDLETIILNAFEAYLTQEEKRSEAEAASMNGPANDPAAKLGVMGGGHGDGIAISIAQRFLPYIIRIAIGGLDDQAVLATRLLTSISRQGLVHPKEVGSTMIALGTSPNKTIADIAFTEHKALHEKHETILEKEYLRAIEMAYRYQRDVVQDDSGATTNPYTSKLCRLIAVMKISKIKNRRRFYDTLCARIDFEPSKVAAEKLPEHLQFLKFIIENLAFFEYPTVDDLLTAVTAMERVVAGLGTGVALSIETEVLNMHIDQPMAATTEQPGVPDLQQRDPFRFEQLTAFSALLSILWEVRTYLRKQYGLMNVSKEGKGKGGTKDLTRAPVRVQGFNGSDKLWETIGNIMSTISEPASALNQCKAFVDLLSVDSDFKLAAEADDDDADPGNARSGTPSDEEHVRGSVTPGGSGKGRKRKGFGDGDLTPSGRKKSKPNGGGGAPRPRGRSKGSGKRQSSADVNEDLDFD